MGFDLHTIRVGNGSTGLSRFDSLGMHLLRQVAYPAGNGDPTAIAAGTAGLGYATIPTVAYANAGSGASATAVANMGVVANPTIAAGGSGGTNGTQTVTGTTGTGTKFQASVTVAGGAITAVLSVTVAGVYTAMPSSLAAEPVTGASLTGAQLNLSACMGVVSYTASYGSSNHKYPQSTTATLSGGTPTTPAVPGAVTVTSVAGQGCAVAVTGINLPLKYMVNICDLGQDAVAYVSSRTQTGFTVNINPRLAASTLVAGNVDIQTLF